MRFGNNETARTRFISSARTFEAALINLRKHANEFTGGIARIDLNLVDENVYDLSTKGGRDYYLTNPIGKNYAKCSQEVVIESTVPAVAVKLKLKINN